MREVSVWDMTKYAVYRNLPIRLSRSIPQSPADRPAIDHDAGRLIVEVEMSMLDEDRRRETLSICSLQYRLVIPQAKVGMAMWSEECI